jgi:hypothetical protein
MATTTLLVSNSVNGKVSLFCFCAVQNLLRVLLCAATLSLKYRIYNHKYAQFTLVQRSDGPQKWGHAACHHNNQPVRLAYQPPVELAYQPPVSSTFLSEQISQQQPANGTFLSAQISTSQTNRLNT